MKRCSECRRELPLETFYRNKRNKDGRDNLCKACRKGWNAYEYERRRARMYEG